MRNKVKADIIFVLCVTIISKLISVLVLGYPARTLGPESFGMVVTALSLTAYVSIIIWPGISNWGAMEIARNPERSNDIISGVLLSRLLLAIFAILFSNIAVYFSSFTIVEKYTISASILILLPLAINCDWVFFGKEAPKYSAMASLLTSVLNLILIFKLVKSPSDAIVYALIAPATLMLSSLSLLFALKRIKIKLIYPSFVLCMNLFKESRHLGFAGAVIILLQYANNLIIRGNLDAAAVGIFGASFYLFQITMLIPATLNSVFMGRVARMTRDLKYHVAIEITKIFELYLIIGLLICFTVYASAPLLIETLYGKLYAESSQLLKIMSVGIFFNFCITASVGFLAAFKEDRAVLITVIVSLFTAIIGGVLLIPIFGLAGAAFTFAAIDAIGLLVSIVYLRHQVPDFCINKYGYSVAVTVFTVFIFEWLPETIPMFMRITLGVALLLAFLSKKIYKCLNELFSINQH